MTKLVWARFPLPGQGPWPGRSVELEGGGDELALDARLLQRGAARERLVEELGVLRRLDVVGEAVLGDGRDGEELRRGFDVRLRERLGPGADYLDVFCGAFEVGCWARPTRTWPGSAVVAPAGRERDNGGNKGDGYEAPGHAHEYRWRAADWFTSGS